MTRFPRNSATNFLVGVTESDEDPNEEYQTQTSATRTILDAAEAGTAPEQIELAVVQAIRRGLAIPDQLRHEAVGRGRRAAALVDGALNLAAA